VSNDKEHEHDGFEALLSMVGDAFIAHVEATRELLALAEQSQERELDIEASREALNEEQRRQLGEKIGEFTDALQKILEGMDRGEGKQFTLSFGGTETPVARVMTRLLMRGAHQARMPSRDLLLRRSMLSLLVSDFELLLSEVMRILLREHSGLGGLSEATVTLAELERFGDIGSARSALIERKVDDLMRKSLDDWVKWFARFGVNWRDMCRNWASFSEIFARRNVFVHAGGKVTEQYVAALDEATELDDDRSIGDQLALDHPYLEQASEELLAFGVLLVGGTWLQLRPKGSLCESWVASRTTELLNLGYFRAVETVSSTVLAKTRGRFRRSSELKLRTDAWVARRELGDGDKVREEVGRWEVDGIDLIFSHAKTVLLENDDQAVAQVKELMRRGYLTSFDLLTTPLYRELLERRRGDLLDASESPDEVSLRLVDTAQGSTEPPSKSDEN
jgi:hypothetical protein